MLFLEADLEVSNNLFGHIANINVNQICSFFSSFLFLINEYLSFGAMTFIIMQVYIDLFAIAILLLGGALACYGE